MKANLHSPIGIVDSGMGGISIWTDIVRMMPHERILYWTDSANCPYGGREREEIVSLISTGVEVLVEAGAKIIVIACNTATIAAIETLRSRWVGVRFVGVEPAVKPAATSSSSGVIGVLGTAYTINSPEFRQTVDRYADRVRVVAVAGIGLVKQVEQGVESDPETETLLRGYIEPMMEAGADKLVLACTHYPLLLNQIQAIIGSAPIDIINPSLAVARQTHKLLRDADLLTDKLAVLGDTQFLGTGGEDEILKIKLRAEQYMNSMPGGRNRI